MPHNTVVVLSKWNIAPCSVFGREEQCSLCRPLWMSLLVHEVGRKLQMEWLNLCSCIPRHHTSRYYMHMFVYLSLVSILGGMKDCLCFFSSVWYMHGIYMPPFVLVWLQWHIKTYKHGLAGLLHGYSVCCHCDTESMVHNLQYGLLMSLFCVYIKIFYCMQGVWTSWNYQESKKTTLTTNYRIVYLVMFFLFTMYETQVFFICINNIIILVCTVPVSDFQ